MFLNNLLLIAFLVLALSYTTTAQWGYGQFGYGLYGPRQYYMGAIPNYQPMCPWSSLFNRPREHLLLSQNLHQIPFLLSCPSSSRETHVVSPTLHDCK
ncbi:unnamed protein product, partial [Cylicocyclus nassatus]